MGTVFQSYYGGIPAARGTDEIYFMGIIDILQVNFDAFLNCAKSLLCFQCCLRAVLVRTVNSIDNVFYVFVFVVVNFTLICFLFSILV